MYRIPIPNDTFCPQCNLAVAPFAPHVKFIDKTFHQECFNAFWHAHHYSASGDVRTMDRPPVSGRTRRGHG